MTETDISSPSQKLDTKTRILNAALRIFNERGFYSTTTHDIAEAAHMSPGNLYYHYQNKEEIVRELFNRMEIFSEQKWFERGPLNPKESFLDFIRFFFGNLERYRFFFREFSLIVKTVPAMSKLWRQRYNHLLGAMRQAVGLWTEAGILKRFKNETDVDYFIETCWILTNFSAVHLDLSYAKSTKDDLSLFVRFLYPYHTAKGQRALDLYL